MPLLFLLGGARLLHHELDTFVGRVKLCVRTATSSKMTPDQKMDLLLTRHARRKLKVRLREHKAEYELSKAGMSTSKAGVPTPRQSLPSPALQPAAKAIMPTPDALPQPKPPPPAHSLPPTPEFDMRDSSSDAEMSRSSSPAWASSSRTTKSPSAF